jgi:5-methylcytosine-specific restriction endonuclease McrA
VKLLNYKLIWNEEMKTLKQRLRSQADKLWFEKHLEENCEVCGCSEWLQVHHIFPKGLYASLRYDDDNASTLCRKCHFRHHHLGDPTIHQAIIENRGQKWYNRLKKKSRICKSSFLTIKYYEDAIKDLSA